MRWAELDEVIVVTADGTRGLADGFDLNPRHGWQGTREELALNFPSNGNLILEAPALVFLFNELADRTGHLIEGFSQLTQLVAALDLHAMREVHGLHILGATVEIGNRPGNPPREDNPRHQRSNFDEQEDNSDKDKQEQIRVAQFARIFTTLGELRDSYLILLILVGVVF